MKNRIILEKLESEDPLEKVNGFNRQYFVKQLSNKFGLIEKLPDYYIDGSIEYKLLVRCYLKNSSLKIIKFEPMKSIQHFVYFVRTVRV